MSNVVTLTDLRKKEEDGDYCCTNNNANNNTVTLMLREKKILTKEETAVENKIIEETKVKWRNQFNIFDNEILKFDLDNLNEQLNDPNAPQHNWLVNTKIKIQNTIKNYPNLTEKMKKEYLLEFLNIILIKAFNQEELERNLDKINELLNISNMENEHLKRENEILKNYIKSLPQEDDDKKKLEKCKQANDAFTNDQNKNRKSLTEQERRLAIRKKFFNAQKVGKELANRK